MKKNQSSKHPQFLSAITLVVLLAGCAGDEVPGGHWLAENRLSSGSSILEGLPTNDQLPLDLKADLVLPEQFDLIESQTPVLDQGRRGTCVKFAALGLLQHLHKAGGAGLVPDLSEAFMQWSVKVEQGASPMADGNNAQDVLTAVNTFGVVEEHYWPYSGERWGSMHDPACRGDGSYGQPVQCYTNGDPPYGAMHGPRWHIGPPQGLNSDPRNIKQTLLMEEQAVILSVPTYRQAWSQSGQLPVDPEMHRQGIVLYPNDEDVELSRQANLVGHAVLLVGWDDHMSAQRRGADGQGLVSEDGEPVVDTGFFLFKNSWGVNAFGRQNAAQAGYGWIPYAYVKKWGRVTGASLRDYVPAEQCEGRVDEDSDGLTDCEDVECFWEPVCLGIPAARILRQEVIGPLLIPDEDPAGLSSELIVVEELEIAGLEVEVDVEHGYIDDLRFVLQRLDEQGAVTGEVVLREPEQEDGVEAYPRFALRFHLDDFDGQIAAGRWRLLVSDHFEEDTGQINDWQVEITAPAPAPTEPALIYQNQESQEIPYEGSMSSTIEVTGAELIGGLTVAVQLSYHETLAEIDAITLQRVDPNAAPGSPDFIQDQVVLLPPDQGDVALDASNPAVSDGRWDGMLFSTHFLDGLSAAGTYRLVIDGGEPWADAYLERWGIVIDPLGAPARLESASDGSAAPEGGEVTSDMTISATGVIDTLQLKVWVEQGWDQELVLTLRRLSGDGTVEHEEVIGEASWFRGEFPHHYVQLPLMALAGQPFAGRWQLVITDLNGTDEWTLEKWALTTTVAGD